MPPPTAGEQQTASMVIDLDQDDIITKRRAAPSVVWYKKIGYLWDGYVVENEATRIEVELVHRDITGVLRITSKGARVMLP